MSQSAFATALLDPDTPPPEGLTDGRGRPAQRRFGVYRNNVASSLTDALETGFPVVARLVGKEFFRAMAAVFLRSHPPEDPRLQLWGGRFPGFLARFEPVAQIPYLPDVARLELGLRQSYHAEDTPVLPLAGLSPESVLALRPRLAPSTLILGSRFPVLSIWQRNARDAKADIPVGGETILVARIGYDPEPRLLPAGGHALARHLKGRLTLADALAAAQADTPEADLGALMTLFLTPGVLTPSQGNRPCAA